MQVLGMSVGENPVDIGGYTQWKKFIWTMQLHLFQNLDVR